MGLQLLRYGQTWDLACSTVVLGKAWLSCLDSRAGEHASPTVVDRVSSNQPLARIQQEMALCFLQEIGLADDVLPGDFLVEVTDNILVEVMCSRSPHIILVEMICSTICSLLL